MMSIMNGRSLDEFVEYLNKRYDEVDDLDRQIDLMILRRNHIMNEIESGVAMLMKYGYRYKR